MIGHRPVVLVWLKVLSSSSCDEIDETYVILEAEYDVDKTFIIKPVQGIF